MVNCYGLTTSEALGRLQFIIQEELDSHSKKNKKTLLYLLWETLSSDKETRVTWYSLVASVLLAAALSVNIAFDESVRLVHFLSEYKSLCLAHFTLGIHFLSSRDFYS